MPYSRHAIITFLDNDGMGLSPDNSLPSAPAYPSQGLPGYGRPDNSLPRPPGSIGTLPVFPFDPTGHPDNSLPGPQPTPTPPIQLHPGLKLVVKFMACYGFVAVPDNSLPETPEPK